MFRTGRLVIFAALGGAAVLAAPTPAAAQVMVSGGVGGAYLGPTGGPLGGPNFRYRQGLSVQVGTPLGPSIGYTQQYYGAVGWWMARGNNPAVAPRYYMYPGAPYGPYGPGYNAYGVPTGGYNGYVSGGVRNPAVYDAQQSLGSAQRQGAYVPPAPAGARTAISEQVGVERGNPPSGPGGGRAVNPPPDLAEALAAASESRLMSGEYLNRIKDEITLLEARGAKAPSAQFGPPLLSEVTFGGSPAGDALTVIRRAGRLEFPVAFDAVPELQPLRTVIGQDLVAVTGPVRLGRPVDPLKVIKLEEDVRKAHAALTPAINSLPFEDATSARKFLNQLDATVKVLRDPKMGGLVNPAWDTAGASAADLVRHMAKYKVQFGPADPDAGDAYLAVHQGLAAYWFALSQNEPKKP